MRVVKYQRVSTSTQEVENQTSSIDNQIERLGWITVGEYKDPSVELNHEIQDHNYDNSYKTQEKESSIELLFTHWID